MAAWCHPCIQELPHLNALDRKYRPQGLKTVGISLDYAGPEAMQPIIDDLKVGFPIYWTGEAAIEKYDFLDGDRACALGASYGGFMVNWIAGNWPDRFTCLVNHDGLFDTEFMYYSTEEQWFPEREFLGPPFESREAYDRWNPSLHVDKWQTPMLVVHGELDHRVPITQGLATFNALQRKGVPSRLLYYPDENHWVLKPKNSIQWHEVVLEWMDRWTGGEAAE